MSNKKINCIYVNAKFLSENPTGIGRFSIEISRELIKMVPNLVFVSPPKIVNTLVAKELKVIKLGIGGGWLWEQFFLPIYLYFYGKPLLLSFTSTAPILYKNQIVTIHDLTAIKHPEWYSFKSYLYYKILYPLISKNSKKIITVSQFVKNDLVNILNVEEKKVCVVYNAIGNQFKPKQTNRQEKYLLCVGSLDPRKNFKRTIQAFLDLNLEGYKLKIIGQKHIAFRNIDFEIPASQLEKIEFTGYVPDEALVEYYSNADLFLYMSLEEGFGIPPLEAISCGTLVLTSNTSCIPEICENAVLYANPENVTDIKLAISHALQMSYSDKQKKIEEGKILLKKYSWEISAEKISKLF